MNTKDDNLELMQQIAYTLINKNSRSQYMRIVTALIASSFLLLTSANADELQEKTHDITIQVHINCPESPEFIAFAESIPAAGQHATSFEEWKASFVANMTRLIALVESEQVNNSSWGVNTQEHVEQPAE